MGIPKNENPVTNGKLSISMLRIHEKFTGTVKCDWTESI